MTAIGLPVLLVLVVVALAIGLGAARRPEPTDPASRGRGTGAPASRGRGTGAPGTGDADLGDPGAPGGGRSVVLLVAAGVVVVAVVVTVVAVGIERPPALEAIGAGGASVPDASLAWIGAGEGPDGSCLHLAHPDGAVQELTCDLVGDELVAWIERGIVVRSWSETTPRLVVLDASTGEVLEHLPDDDEDGWGWPGAQGVWSQRDGDELVVQLADDGQELWRVTAPRTYDVHVGARSPDGAWVAAVDAADRLLVLPVDGAAEPQLWAQDVPSWTPIVWEGTEVATDPTDGNATRR